MVCVGGADTGDGRVWLRGISGFGGEIAMYSKGAACAPCSAIVVLGQQGKRVQGVRGENSPGNHYSPIIYPRG